MEASVPNYYLVYLHSASYLGIFHLHRAHVAFMLPPENKRQGNGT